MRLLNYTIEANLRSLHPATHFKITRPWRSAVTHLVWWKLHAMWSRTQYCEFCEVETGLSDVCDDCHQYHFCECGTQLEDAAGSPGDGLCRGCN